MTSSPTSDDVAVLAEETDMADMSMERSGREVGMEAMQLPETTLSQL